MAQLNDLGIDLGTSNVLIYQQGKGLVLRRPAVVAIERSTKKVLAIGDDAQRMVGRTPSNIMAIRPLKQGTVADFELTNTMLRFFLNGVLSKRLFSGPRVVMSVPSGVTETEKHSLINILLDAGVKRTYLLDRPLAAALGVGMDLRQRYGRMIVDMGAGITDIAVISEGEIVQSSSVYYAGDYFDDAIVRYIRKKYSLLIGERTAEQIKINIGTAMKPETDEANLAMPVVGRNQLSGLPRTQEIHAAEIYEALKDPVAALIGSIQDVLVRTPPQLASDIFDDGIVLSGGAAGLARLPEAIYTALHIPCGVADDPQTQRRSRLRHCRGRPRRLRLPARRRPQGLQAPISNCIQKAPRVFSGSGKARGFLFWGSSVISCNKEFKEHGCKFPATIKIK